MGRVKEREHYLRRRQQRSLLDRHLTANYIAVHLRCIYRIRMNAWRKPLQCHLVLVLNAGALMGLLRVTGGILPTYQPEWYWDNMLL